MNTVYLYGIMLFAVVGAFFTRSIDDGLDLRKKRQDDDAAFTRYNNFEEIIPEVGVQIDDACTRSCSKVLANVFCNRTSKKCQCDSKYPVNIESHVCVKGSKLQTECLYTEACEYYDSNSICDESSKRCVCSTLYIQEKVNGTYFCTKVNSIFYAGSTNFWILISGVCGFIFVAAIVCLTIHCKTSNRTRQSGHDQYVGDGNISDVPQQSSTSHHSIGKQHCHHHCDASSCGCRRNSCTVYSTPLCQDSRRTSTASLHSPLYCKECRNTNYLNEIKSHHQSDRSYACRYRQDHPAQCDHQSTVRNPEQCEHHCHHVAKCSNHVCQIK